MEPLVLRALDNMALTGAAGAGDFAALWARGVRGTVKKLASLVTLVIRLHCFLRNGKGKRRQDSDSGWVRRLE